MMMLVTIPLRAENAKLDDMSLSLTMDRIGCESTGELNNVMMHRWHSIAIVVKLDVIDVWINFKLHYSSDSNGGVVVLTL